MRNLCAPDLDLIRDRDWERRGYGGTPAPHREGCFKLRVGEAELAIIVSTGGGWDHISVSLRDRMPSWEEMEAVKRRFFQDDETAMQLHVPPADHINCHPHVLHLWRPQFAQIPRPPASFVGPRT
jgi:hypothetical protein